MNSSNQNGTILIALIFAMMVAAALGLITLSMNTISAYNEMNVNNFNKAYYLAESGRRYVAMTSDVSNIDHTLTEGGKFSVKKEGMKTFSITGVVNQGTIFEAAKKVSYIDVDPCVNTLSPCNTFIPKGLSYWNFDEEADPGKDSWGGKDATLNGGAVWSDVWTEKGMVKGALSFDGIDDYLSTPFKPNVIGDDQPFTIVFWAKLKSSAKQTLLGTTDGTNHFSVGIDSGNWYWEYGDKDSNTVSPTSLLVSLDKWQHITLVYTGSAGTPAGKMAICVNGEQVASYDYGASGGNGKMPGSDLFIGAKNDNGTDAFHSDSLLDEIAIYDRVLDYNEIKRIICANGLSYWSFNDEDDPGKDYWGDKDAALKGATAWSDVWQNDFTDCLTEFEGADGFLEFDGANVYLSTPFKPGDIGVNKPFTVLSWAKPTDLGVQTLLGTTDGTDHFSLGIDASDNWYWEYGDNSDTSIAAIKDEWQHVAVVYTGTTRTPECNIITYLNASQSISYDYGASGGNATLPNKELFIGAKNNNGADSLHFKGFIDETAIYDRALTICEIREFYNEICHAGCEAVAYYPFNCNAEDESGWCQTGNGNNGTVNGATLTSDRFSCLERAYQFDGTDDYIHVPDADKLDLSTEGTLAAWIYINNYNDLAGIIHKGDKGTFSDEAYSLQFQWQDSGNGKKRILFAVQESVLSRRLESDIEMNLNEWYYVAGTWDKDGMYLYMIDKNNILTYREDTSVKNISARNTMGGLNIGAQLIGTEQYASNGNCPFNGIIDDVVVYNTALEKEEIEKLAQDRP